MGICSINNGINSVNITILSWEEGQESSPAIRDVPTGFSQTIDTGTYLLKCREVEMSCRFTDDEKDTLIDIFNGNIPLYINLLPESGDTGWLYYGWLREKNVKWEYKKTNYPTTDNETNYERVWYATLTFDVQSFTYYSDFINMIEG
jgi:hypothetical protein